MQAYSPILPVGTQHHCKNSFDVWITIFRTDKFWGLLRGVDAAILRTAMGSSVQLPTYKWAKNQLGSHGLYPSNSILTYLASSSVSGICVVFLLYQVANNCSLTPRSALSRSLPIRPQPEYTTNQQRAHLMDV
ncbi:hypothetical protein DFJ58DRAFT_772442 [Suillus subalutaceus]|uniref:uncharacterized protein n=1 Tax=Suillus subalutaceus TaxID=48586 RepID=UPI001B86AAA2|nr:uncharacterized protein DFJ58DRAFT_772442 [Suillus subalutaceus]KAG1864683.1 hypothetical protein DFJ58DRAFT_772442 [Suillus subalutaceus]